MMRPIIPVPVIVICITVGCFAEESSKPPLVWTKCHGDCPLVDNNDMTILFDSNDIEVFDWDKQIFQLTRTRAMDLMASKPILYASFAVYDSQGRIYMGYFVSPFYSGAISEPVIIEPFLNYGPQPPLFAISCGYPGNWGQEDLRFAPRLHAALDRTGVLGQIDPNDPPIPIERESHGWFGKKGGLRIWIEIFPETLRLGQSSRIHLQVIGTEELNPLDYMLEVDVDLSANQGHYHYTTTRSLYAYGEGWKNIYILNMDPWNPLQDPNNSYDEASPAWIQLTARIRMILDQETGTLSDPIDSVTTDQIEVTIQPQTMDPVQLGP